MVMHGCHDTSNNCYTTKLLLRAFEIVSCCIVDVTHTLAPLMTTLDFASMYKNAKLSSKKKEKADGEREISLIPALDDVGCQIGDEGLLFKRTIFTDEQVVRLSNIIRSLTNGCSSANGREVMLFGGVPHPNGAILERFPSWLEEIANSLAPSCNRASWIPKTSYYASPS
jgi:hypothetical protein